MPTPAFLASARSNVSSCPNAVAVVDAVAIAGTSTLSVRTDRTSGTVAVLYRRREDTSIPRYLLGSYSTASCAGSLMHHQRPTPSTLHVAHTEYSKYSMRQMNHSAQPNRNLLHPYKVPTTSHQMAIYPGFVLIQVYLCLDKTCSRC